MGSLSLNPSLLDTMSSYNNPLCEHRSCLLHSSSDLQLHPHAEMFYQLGVVLSQCYQNKAEENYILLWDIDPIHSQKIDFLFFKPH